MEVNWQDGDSSSAKGFRYSFANEQESKVMLCGGHIGRAHGKKLQELQGKGSFFIDLYKEQFPQMESLKCVCLGKKRTFVATRNKPACGLHWACLYTKCKKKPLLCACACWEGPRCV